MIIGSNAKQLTSPLRELKGRVTVLSKHSGSWDIWTTNQLGLRSRCQAIEASSTSSTPSSGLFELSNHTIPITSWLKTSAEVQVVGKTDSWLENVVDEKTATNVQFS